MSAAGYTLFETAIGCCGLAWDRSEIVGLQLPRTEPAQTRADLRRRFPRLPEAPPPPDLQPTIDGIRALLRGEPSDLSAAPLDLSGLPAFDRQVYEVARTIPAGKTLSYGQIAERLGTRGAAREVGQALGRNPFPILVPCHRVVAAGGKLGGFSAPGGARTKLRLLSIEGAPIASTPSMFDDQEPFSRTSGRPT
jgi:methylated-DNA-[protein]-cysteine S-methyltransferase